MAVHHAKNHTYWIEEIWVFLLNFNFRIGTSVFTSPLQSLLGVAEQQQEEVSGQGVSAYHHISQPIMMSALCHMAIKYLY